MNLIDARKELEEIGKQLGKSFEQNIRELLEEGELMSYYPEEPQNKDEIQKELIIDFLAKEGLYRKQLIKRAKELDELLNEAQSLQYTLDMLKEVEIIESTHSVVSKDIRRKVILIEKNTKRTNEYDVMDWLFDADPENFLGFL